MISLKNVSYRITGGDGKSWTILKDITLSIEKGARIAIMGPNGSGKTTLAKLIGGLIVPSEGDVTIGSISTKDRQFRKRLGTKVGFLFQNPEHQILSINVERELAFGLENYGLETDIIRDRVNSLLELYGLAKMRQRSPARLSGGEKQILALASVMILNPGILVLDEPNAHLDKCGKELLRIELDRLKEDQELVIIQVARNFEEAEDFDRILMLLSGSIAESCAPRDIIKAPAKLKHYGIDYPISFLLRKPVSAPSKGKFPATASSDRPVHLQEIPDIEMECSRLNFGWGNQNEKALIHDLDYCLAKGVIHGILGPIGCGKSSLAMILSGLVRPNMGELLLEGKIAGQEDLIKAVSYLFQSPERGMFASSLYEDIAYGPRNFGVADDKLEGVIKKSMRVVGLDFDRFKDRSPFNLSGGEARLAAIAGGIATGKSIIILDEPTEELDYPAKRKIKRLIRNLAAEGKTILLISHDSDFIFEMADFIALWLENGPVTYRKYDLYGKMELFGNAGSEVPKVIELADRYGYCGEFAARKIDTLDHPDLTEMLVDYRNHD